MNTREESYNELEGKIAVYRKRGKRNRRKGDCSEAKEPPQRESEEPRGPLGNKRSGFEMGPHSPGRRRSRALLHMVTALQLFTSNCFTAIPCFYIHPHGCRVGSKATFTDEEESTVWEVESYFEKCSFVFCSIIDVVAKSGWFSEARNSCGLRGRTQHIVSYIAPVTRFFFARGIHEQSCVLRHPTKAA